MFPVKLIDLQLSPSRSEYKDFSTNISENDLDYDTFKLDQMHKPPLIKKSSSYPRNQYKQQLIEESNIDGDQIIQECNRFIQDPQVSVTQLLQDLALDQPKKNRSAGFLKFFDENKNYGFIVMDSDGSDIFVYADDLTKTGISKEYLRTAKFGNCIRFTFTCMEYYGKYNKSRKAIDLEYQKPGLFTQSLY
ncbi:unnamed protein product (macronuclear) [Paramecium tetraurelia]|uniref:Uncharacterized protein n=2 Tax=Paramecium TaxID=5884 RepID=A0BKP7_PARTE|nr:uncharacterized protein GSPATT00029745001 [Paramecium tetraurelia]CAD8201134.1 unnamed protein product [Paramecium octaurelia]CAK59114.1 unnamed protein product [Paramecium tetraurelia]|eukprot:XP_001426512.1 hypothetical protein (macronuclear) [Paramecium tetraurelia strain d4-2]